MIILTILGAFLWRLRGGLLNDLTGVANYKIGPLVFNDTTVRIIWSIGMAGAFCLLHPGFHWIGSYWLSHSWLATILGFIVLSVALFGSAVIGWFGAQLLPTKWKDIGLLSFSGIVRMIFPAIALLSFWPLVAGILFGPAYWVATKIPRTKPWEFWGEIVCGAVIGFFLNFA